MPETETPTVFAAWSAVMAEVTAVGKDGEFRSNTANYNFRGIDGVMNAVGPALRKHGVLVIPSVLDATYREVETGKQRTLMRECTVKVRYRVHGPAGDYFDGEVYGEALDSSDKGTAKATSVAYRIFLLQSLTIPTHEPDPDESRPERSARPEPAPAAISAENVERMRKACTDAGAQVEDVVLIATNSRTTDPAELLTTEIAAARDALRRITEAPASGGTEGESPHGPELEPDPALVSVGPETGEGAAVPASSPASGGNGKGAKRG